MEYWRFDIHLCRRSGTEHHFSKNRFTSLLCKSLPKSLPRAVQNPPRLCLSCMHAKVLAYTYHVSPTTFRFYHTQPTLYLPQHHGRLGLGAALHRPPRRPRRRLWIPPQRTRCEAQLPRPPTTLMISPLQLLSLLGQRSHIGEFRVFPRDSSRTSRHPRNI
jgi:hypothetical protein